MNPSSMLGLSLGGDKGVKYDQVGEPRNLKLFPCPRNAGTLVVLRREGKEMAQDSVQWRALRLAVLKPSLISSHTSTSNWTSFQDNKLLCFLRSRRNLRHGSRKVNSCSC
jgi:hypothetical protein